MLNELPFEHYLSQYFNFTTFRPGQREVIEEVVAGEKDILAIMPTGRGKSLCYQLSGLLLPGITLIISPLVALMKDQVDSLVSIGIDQATFLNSQISLGEQRKRIQAIVQGRYKLVYVAPERLRNQAFLEMIQQVQVALLVVDEAHCVSQWGHDFRPDYLWIRQFVSSLAELPRLMALTATATPNVQADILKQLGIPLAKKIVSSSDRPNLCYQVNQVHSDTEKKLALAKLIKQASARVGGPASGIIYAATRKDCEQVAGWLRSQLRIKVGYYHAGLSPQDRTEVQELFIREELPVVVATNAFGMGIDKANIRFIVHYSLPASLESYNQEVGRAGRDGLPAECLLLFAPKDKALQSWMIRNDTLAVPDLQAFLALLKGKAASTVLYLTYEELAAKGLEETKVRVAVSELERVKALRLIERDSTGLKLEITTANVERDTLLGVIERLNRLTEERINKLEVMTRWINTSRCRRAALLAYFGEEKPGEPAVCCDNCTSGSSLADQTAPDAISRAGLAVLTCVAELNHPLGRTKVADILLGSKRKDILATGLNKQPSYGKLSGLAGREILQTVDRLLGDGYLTSSGAQYPVIALTQQGKQALNKVKPVELEPASGFKQAIPLQQESKVQTPILLEQDCDLDTPLQIIPVSEEIATTTQPTGKKTKLAEELKTTIGNLLGQGLTPEEIAERVDRSLNTVAKYLGQLIQEGRLPVDRLVSWEVRSLIYKAMEQVGMSRLKPIKQMLPEYINYETISYVIASLNQGQEEAEAVDGILVKL